MSKKAIQVAWFRIVSILLIPATLNGLHDKAALAQHQGPFLANGFKVGEVTQDSAIVWVRLTQNASINFDQLPNVNDKESEIPQSMPLEVAPGAEGIARIRYRELGATAWHSTDWQSVDSDSDHIAQVGLEDLIPNTRYQVQVEAAAGTDSSLNLLAEGQFRTAPARRESEKILFIVSTCQAVRSIDAGPEGHVAYRHMLNKDPHFFVHTGDILYYDKLPLCKTVAQARAKWNLMFGFQFNREFHQNVASYFMKDDHDTLKNDCWPGQKYGEITFDEGLSIFREQVPMGEKTYRTIRWGKDVQIWLTENRDYRSSNRQPDGPDKTILGAEQKQWLKESIRNSDATYRFVISPGPIVGPDKRGKADNHSNAAFRNEGQELRDFLSSQTNLFVICGDRHWQYCSKDPETGLVELGCGPINDEHNFGGNPGRNKDMHKYFSPKGGFLAVEVDGEQATAKWFSCNELVDDSEPKLMFEIDLSSEQ